MSAADKVEADRLKGLKVEELRQEYQRVIGVKPGHKIVKDQLIKFIIQRRQEVRT